MQFNWKSRLYCSAQFEVERPTAYRHRASGQPVWTRSKCLLNFLSEGAAREKILALQVYRLLTNLLKAALTQSSAPPVQPGS